MVSCQKDLGAHFKRLLEPKMGQIEYQKENNCNRLKHIEYFLNHELITI